ncbi:MAG: hypothetical protein U0V54_13545 [Saprospiraceae bacterium]
MGMNISGIAINKNYENDFENLAKSLRWKLKKQAEIDFGTAVSNWKEKGICDVYFSETGTVLFVNMEMCAEGWGLENDNALTFILSETSMAFNLHYCENGIHKRILIDVEGKRVFSRGDPMSVEANSGDMANIILNQLEVVIGKSFWDIEHTEKAYRYIFVDDSDDVEEDIVTDEPHSDKIMENDILAKNSETKKWWEFWK